MTTRVVASAIALVAGGVLAATVRLDRIDIDTRYSPRCAS
jgi:hypothetical protein